MTVDFAALEIALKEAGGALKAEFACGRADYKTRVGACTVKNGLKS